MWYLLLPFLVVATEYGYHLEGLPPEQSWALYVMRGILMVFVFVLLWVYRPRWALGWIGRSLAFGCGLGVFEESQNALCGIAEWKNPEYVGNLCVHKFGLLPYQLLVSGILAYYVVKYIARFKKGRQQ